jgi:predicted dehydrogenase
LKKENREHNLSSRLLLSSTIHSDDKTEIIEKALRAGKHVLADDPVTTSVTEYCRLVNLAHQCRRHLQDTTMFVYHHAVREFLDCILDEKSFGEITEIKALFDINPKDGRFRGILDPNDAANERRGVIGDLCRYCAVLGLLIFQRSGRKALSAQITGIARDDKGILNHVVCQVNFEGVSLSCLFIRVFYMTRQIYQFCRL